MSGTGVAVERLPVKALENTGYIGVGLGREVGGRAGGSQKERNISEQVFEKCICFTHMHVKK